MPEVDAILIATETARHADLAIKAIAAGKVSRHRLFERY